MKTLTLRTLTNLTNKIGCYFDWDAYSRNDTTTCVSIGVYFDEDVDKVKEWLDINFDGHNKYLAKVMGMHGTIEQIVEVLPLQSKSEPFNYKNFYGIIRVPNTRYGYSFLAIYNE